MRHCFLLAAARGSCPLAVPGDGEELVQVPSPAPGEMFSVHELFWCEQAHLAAQALQVPAVCGQMLLALQHVAEVRHHPCSWACPGVGDDRLPYVVVGVACEAVQQMRRRVFPAGDALADDEMVVCCEPFQDLECGGRVRADPFPDRHVAVSGEAGEHLFWGVGVGCHRSSDGPFRVGCELLQQLRLGACFGETRPDLRVAGTHLAQGLVVAAGHPVSESAQDRSIGRIPDRARDVSLSVGCRPRVWEAAAPGMLLAGQVTAERSRVTKNAPPATAAAAAMPHR